MKPILYDSLLVHYLARALHDRFVARRLRALRVDSDARRLVLEFDRDRLIWELHPTRGWLRSASTNRPEPGGDHDEAARAATEGWGGRRVRTQRRPRVRRIHAPLDERWIEIEIDAGGAGRASRVVVELMTNQWNAIALDPERTIVAVLWSREAGDRRLRVGETYVPPRPGGRVGRDAPVPEDQFRSILGSDQASSRRALLQGLAWSSSLNVDALLGGESDDGSRDLAAAYARYRALAERPDPDPGLLVLRDGQPYPLPLPGVDRQPASTLFEAFEVATQREAPAGLAPEVRDALARRRDDLRRKATALERQVDRAPGRAAELRSTADLLMARLHEVPRGQDRVELLDFEGQPTEIELDPARSPAENAEALYDRARKRERAAQRLPARIREVRTKLGELEALLEELDHGTADPGAVRRWVDRVMPSSGAQGGTEERRPYRSYRSSGGLEIRVGRTGRANDALTFHHSSPHDIWLHARDVAGAHVILRWPDREQNPPRRDLLEAAVLAALHSKARTAATVPVDWTRRKYVRSPRKAAPGVVLPDRVTTVFVEPDAAVEERLRPDE